MTGPVSQVASGTRVAAPGPVRVPTARILARRLALSVTLQMLVLGLLLATVVAVSAVDFLSRQQATEQLDHQLLGVIAHSISSDVRAFLDAGPRTLVDLDTRTTYGRLGLEDRQRLAEFLADRLRYEHTLSRLMYGEAATGALIGAARSDEDEVIIVVADPKVDEGQPAGWIFGPDGTRTPYARDLPPEADARERPWYQAAQEAGGQLVWVGPFAAFDGVPIMAAAMDVRDPRTQELRGVWSAQFSLAALPGMLREATSQRPDGQALLLTRDGGLIASAVPIVPERVTAATAALPAPLSTLPLDTPIPVRFTNEGESWAGGIQGFAAGGNLDWFVGFYLPRSELLQAVYESQRVAFAAGLAFLIVGLAVGAITAGRIARPLRIIADDLIQVAQFQLTTVPSPPSFVKEVAVVSDAVDRMKASLRSFGRYVPTDIVRELLAAGEDARLGGETRTVTIHFSDIENFTHLCERLPPAVVVHHLADYLDWMTATIRDHAGTVNQFVGDGIMAFWNAPNPVPDHATQACRAALSAQEGLCDLQAQWRVAGTPVFRARIGLHTGEALVGNVGTREQFTYTAMGDTTNLASRLETLNKQYGTQILASEAVHDAAGSEFEWRCLDRVAVVGRGEGTVVYELLGKRNAVRDAILQARDLYEQALAAYFAGRFAEAAAGFRRAAAARPDDKASAVMMTRAEQLSGGPLAVDWDGVYVATNK